MKLVLPIIFALLFASDPVACLGLAAALQGCTLLYSLMYRKIYGSPPGSSVSLWCDGPCPLQLQSSAARARARSRFRLRHVRNAALFVSFSLAIIGAALVNSMPPSGVDGGPGLNDANLRRYAIAAAAVSSVAVLALLVAQALRFRDAKR
jgi:hypothetical protein